jgi:hypothetical protein
VRKFISAAAVTALLSVGVAAPTQAHHSVNAQFFRDQEVTVKGVLTKVEPVAPHSWWHFKVTNAAGVAEDWAFESGSPSVIRRAGISVKNDLKVGATYELTYNPPRNGSKTGFMSAIFITPGNRIAMSPNG